MKLKELFSRKPQQHKFCTPCANIPLNLFVGPETYCKYPLYKRYHDLVASASFGCPSCQLFLPYVTPAVEHERIPDHLLNSRHGGRGFKSVSLQRAPLSTGIELMIAYGDKERSSLAQVDWAFEYKYEDRKPPQSNDADELFEAARYWLQTCLAKHIGCREQFSFRESRLPARLIDVGMGDAPDYSLKLCTTAGKQEASMPYFALSHCWGDLRKCCVVTETTNIAQRLQRLPLNELSPTFRDAIVVTRKLGFRYLWIDAMCILQDDMQDWERESAIMSTIYTHAVCTIAASSAEDGSVGLFKRNKTLYMDPVKIRFSRNGQPPIMLLPKDLTPYERFQGPDSNRALNMRGWCLQEDYLSRRMLFYGESGIYWRCHYGDAYESDPRPNRHFERSCELSYKGQENYHYQWLQCVEDFTRRKLTYRNDQLPALSGLAEALVLQEDRNPHDTYLAGIWKDDLLRGLLWKKDSQRKTRIERPNTYLAPSWSWASAAGPVCFEPLFTPEDAPTIIDVHCTPAGANPLGRVTDGYLRLTGLVRRVNTLASPIASPIVSPIVPFSTPLSLHHFKHPPFTNTTREILEEHQNIGPVFPILEPGYGQFLREVGLFYYDDAKDHTRTVDLYCLRMTTINTEEIEITWSSNDGPFLNERSKHPIHCVRVMILALINMEERKFRRVGVGEIKVLSWFDSCEKSELTIV